MIGIRSSRTVSCLMPSKIVMSTVTSFGSLRHYGNSLDFHQTSNYYAKDEQSSLIDDYDENLELEDLPLPLNQETCSTLQMPITMEKPVNKIKGTKDCIRNLPCENRNDGIDWNHGIQIRKATEDNLKSNSSCHEMEVKKLSCQTNPTLFHQEISLDEEKHEKEVGFENKVVEEGDNAKQFSQVSSIKPDVKIESKDCNEEFNSLVEKSFNLLQSFTPDSPGNVDIVLALTMFYQKQGIVKTADFFKVHKSNDFGFWMTFWCPIKKIDFASGIPRPLFANDKKDDRLVQLSLQIFGKYVFHQGKVFFSTKKGAKRAVALTVLQAHRATGTDTDLVVPFVQGIEQVMNSTPRSVAKDEQLKQGFPEWVQQLHAIGIDSNSIEIFYRQSFTGVDMFTPTKLCCVIKVRNITDVTVISQPCMTKRAALEDSVQLLVEEVKRLQIKCSNALPIRELNKLLKCDSTTAIYTKTLPPWANSQVQGKLFLYRIRLMTMAGRDFVTARTGLAKDILTPLGVAFTKPLPMGIATREVFRTHFEIFKPDKEKKEIVIIELSDLTIVDLESLPYPTKESLEVVFSFNCIIYDWKNYGQEKNSKNSFPSKGTIDFMDRTYMFVPLLRNDTDIDWSLLQKIANHETTPYLMEYYRLWDVPILGSITFFQISGFFGYLALFLLIPDVMRGTFSSSKRINNDSSELLDFGLLSILLSLLSGMAAIFITPRRPISKNLLQNRFFIEKKPGGSKLHVTPSKDHCEHPKNRIESRLSGKSSVLKPGTCYVRPDTNNSSGSFDLDLRSATFSDLYRKKYGIKLRYPTEHLLNGIPVLKHTNQDFLFLSKDERFKHLMPELVEVLPMPRDSLYVLRHASNFMAAVEEAIQLHCLSTHLDMDSVTKSTSSSKVKTVASTHGKSNYNCLVSSFYEEALCIKRYQRLEFLGDAVLGYFFSINLMSRNSDLALDSDDLALLAQEACKNSTLYEAALRIGLSSLLRTEKKSWTSIFQQSAKKPNDTIQTLSEITLSDHDFEFSDKVLSDFVEGILGASFLAGSHTDSCHTISWLEKLKLPIPQRSSPGGTENNSWFQATSACITKGYHFQSDESWNAQINCIASVFQDSPCINTKLRRCYDGLLRYLVSISKEYSIFEKLSSHHSSILLMCSLFDDSLTSHDKSGCIVVSKQTANSDEKIQSNVATSICTAALLRDTLGLIGSNALKLIVTRDLMERYPNASEHSLHILRACTLSDDVVTYIMFKAGIHTFLFDQDAVGIPKFEAMMKSADALGKSKWTKSNGWILGSGINEFHARCRMVSRQSDTWKPTYFGLAGGRLFGKKHKIDHEITSDFVFSMKAITGALVLSLGLEAMWSCIGILFEEAMLLSIDELRSEFPESTIIQ